MKACRAGHLCTVQFLISKRADVNRQTTNNDHTPLSLACAGGHLAVVELLLAQSADPFHKLKVRETIQKMTKNNKTESINVKFYSLSTGQLYNADRSSQGWTH